MKRGGGSPTGLEQGDVVALDMFCVKGLNLFLVNNNFLSSVSALCAASLLVAWQPHGSNKTLGGHFCHLLFTKK